MIVDPAYQDRINQIWELYKEAEDEITKISTLSDGLDCTPVNQLRYAGRHLLDALANKTSDPTEEEMSRAIRHCERAIYDAKDTGIVFYLKKIQQFKNDYRGIEVTSVVGNYLDIIKNAREAKNLVDEARAASDGRHNFYGDAKQHFDTLENAYFILEDARDSLNTKLHNHNRNVIFGYIGAVGAIAGIIALLLTIFPLGSSNAQQPSPPPSTEVTPS